MKKRNLIALLLALAMCLSLAACGSGTDSPTSTKDAPGATPAPEYVYTAEFTDFLKDSKDYVYPRVYTDGGFYATSYEKVGEDIPEGVTPEYEGQYDVYQTMLYFASNDGKMKKLEKYQPLPAEENVNGYKDFRASSDLSNVGLASDGNLISIETTWASWFEGPEGMSQRDDEYWNYQKYSQRYYIRKLDKEGAELSCAEIPVDENSYLTTYAMQIDDQGNVLMQDGNSNLRAVALDGTDSYVIKNEGNLYIDSLLKLGDGRIAALTWGENGQEIALIDSEKGAFSESMPVSFNAYNAVPGTGEYDLYYTNGANFYGYSMEKDESEKLFNWLSCDVNGERLGQINVDEDGTITGYLSEYNDKNETYDFQRITVKKVPYDSVPHKETIRLACIGYDYDLADEIIKFNRANDQYRIEMQDYSEYNTEDDYSAGFTKLNTEILAGNVPDIISLSGLNYTQLASKGILEDLYAYIDADPELDRDDYFQNVLGAMEVDGKLYMTVSNFMINTLIGAASVVGDEPGWTYDELEAALATMPEGCDVLDYYVTKDTILQTCLALDMDDFVDWGTGKCNFDSEQFTDLLAFADKFPEEFDWNTYEYSDEDSTDTRLAQGRQMLVQGNIYSIEDLLYGSYQQSLGGDITYIGYPTLNGTGNMINSADSGYGMSAKSPYKDAIWQFLRTFFTKDYQDSRWALPSRRDIFEEKLEEACTIQYQKDGEGNFLLDENGEKIPIARYGMWNGETNEYEEIYSMTDEQAAKLVELVETTTKVADYNSDIFSIVQEQAKAYFAGQKSAEEVAKLIQSKANIFVNEQR